MFGLKIFNQTKFKNLKFEIYKNFKNYFIKLLFFNLKIFYKNNFITLRKIFYYLFSFLFL